MILKHILVPVDGSELSAKAVEKVVSLVKELGAKLTICYAWPENIAPYMGLGAISDPHVNQKVKEQLDSAAQKFLNAAEPQAGLEYQRCLGVTNQPYKLIIQTAEREGCDLILMASDGRLGVSSVLLGSERQKVLTHSNVPVLVYR